MRRLVLALMFCGFALPVWGASQVEFPACLCYSGSITCAADTTCYLPDENGLAMDKDCGKVSVNIGTITGTVTLAIQGKNPGGEFQTFLNGSLTETDAGNYDVPGSLAVSRLKITGCGAGACTGTVVVCGTR